MALYFLVAVFFGLGYFFQSLFGFGAAFITVLGLSFFIPVQTVIAMIPINLVAAALFIILRDLNALKWKIVFKVFIIASPGVIMGSLILEHLNANILIILICLLILFYSLYSFLIKKIILPRFLNIPYLLLSGFVIGATSLGIIFVPYVFQYIKNPRQLRVSLNLLWLLLGMMRLPFYIQSGMINRSYFIMGFSVVPVMLIFTYLGHKVNVKMNTGSYQRSVLIFLGTLVIIRLIYTLGASMS